MKAQAANVPPHKIYPTKNKGRDYFLAKFKPAEGGAWKSKAVPVDKSTIEEAETWFCQEFAPTLSNGAAVQAPAIKTFAGLAPLWFTFIDGKERYREAKGHVNNFLLKDPIASANVENLEPKICRDFIRSIERAPYTVRNVVASVRSFFEDAQNEGWIDHRLQNMFRNRKVIAAINDGKPAAKEAGDNVICFTAEQAKTLLHCEAIPEERRVKYTLAVSSGLRDGELCGLLFRHLDLTEGVVKVERQLRKQVAKKTGSKFAAPKKGSFRVLPLAPLALERSKVWKETGWAAWVGRAPKEDDCVFPNNQGEAFRPRSSELLRADLLLSELPTKFKGMVDRDWDWVEGEFPFTFHALRRTFASLLEAQNVEQPKISALLGHKASGVTAKHYLAKNLKTCAEAISKLPLS